MGSGLLICTDLDRTLIANGRQEESRGARARFDALVSRPEITLVYVTGRHLELVHTASREYRLPEPDYIIADVGTSIYHRESGNRWKNLDIWQAEIGRDWGSRSAADLNDALRDLTELQLQEESKQNRYNLSYYFPSDVDSDALAARVRKRLASARVNARVIYSMDELRGVGLLDVLPESVSKLHALQALMDLLDVAEDDVVFSGDSGNDLEVLVSAIPAVLVANASDELKVHARRLSDERGNSELLYITSGGFLGMNGCYSAGILEGIAHFHPHMVGWMQTPNEHPARTGMENP